MYVTHGLSDLKDPLCRAWTSMNQRCRDLTNSKYGSRGITVCAEWEFDYPAFMQWALANGYAVGLTLDRRENSQGYSPDNCRWATPTTQSRNRRSAAGSSSKFIGVYRCSKRQVWVAQITVDKRKKTLGLFDTAFAAAIKRDQYIVDNGFTDFTLNNVLP